MRNLILINVDETILNNYAQQTAFGLREKIRQIQRANNVDVGLNDDSSQATLTKLGKRLGCHGVCVAERGQEIFVFSSQAHQVIWSDKKSQDFVTQLRKHLVAFLKSRITKKRSRYLEGEISSLVENMIDSEDPRSCYILDASRNHSLLCSFLEYDRNEEAWLVSTDEMQSLIHNWCHHLHSIDLEKKYQENQDLKFDFGHKFEYLLIHTNEAEKARAITKIKELNWYGQIFMIGSSAQDWLGKDVIHCAVANANDFGRYKSNCNYVSQSPLTLGVIECLDWIIKQKT